MPNIGWSFPENNGGEERGLNNAGIETFSGRKMESLAREIIQNSLDAREDNNKPVKVSFDLIQTSKTDIPQIRDYELIFSRCHDYWEKNEKANAFFSTALQMLQQEHIPMLKISDYNTSGLTGAQLDRGGHFHSLIKSEGVSNKQGGKGGSFGIGKNAPFATSAFRTVYYSTYDIEGVKAVQGVAKLVTHYSKENKTTQGTGYFGKLEGNKPILELEQFPNFIQNLNRTEHGTDIFVLGFCEDESWEVTVLRNIIENFLFAIFKGDLEVSIGNLKVNADTLEAYIMEYLLNEKGYDAFYYYQSIKNGLHFKENFPKLGEVELYLIFKENAPKKIAMMRTTGMIIERYNPRSVPKEYAAVFVGNGDRVNDILRRMENPEHTAWEPDRIDNKKQRTEARQILKSLKNWIRETIFAEIIPEETETIEVDFIGDFLPDDIDEKRMANQDGKGTTGEVEIDKVKHKKQSAFIFTESMASFEDGESEENSSGLPSKKKNKRKKNQRGKGSGDDQIFSSKQKSLKYARSVFNQQKNMYELILESSEKKSGFIKLYVLGDDGKILVNAKKAELAGIPKKLCIEDGKIGPIELPSDKKTRITVQLEYGYRAALEVNFYES